MYDYTALEFDDPVLLHSYYEKCTHDSYACDLTEFKCINVINSNEKWCVREEECEDTIDGLASYYD